MKLGDTVLIRSKVVTYCTDRECVDVEVQCEDGEEMLFDVPTEQVITEQQFVKALSIVPKAQLAFDPSKYIEAYVRSGEELVNNVYGKEEVFNRDKFVQEEGMLVLP